MADYEIGSNMPAGYKPNPFVVQLTLPLIEKALAITGGKPNDRPPPQLTKPIEEEAIRRGPGLIVQQAKELVITTLEQFVFGHSELNSSENVPISDRPGYAPDVEQLTEEEARRAKVGPFVLPMWTSDP